jgi:hypothetical protein
MGFNKRFINYGNLLRVSDNGINSLISYVTNPDCLIVNCQDGSLEVVKVIQNYTEIDIIKQELKRINFYEFK